MRRLQHWGRVFAGAVVGLGLAASLVTVLVGGSVVTAAAFLLHTSHRTLAVAVVGAGAVLAVLEGSYRVWSATDRELQETRVRLRELDTPGAKRSYLDEMDAEARQMAEEIESLSDEDEWYPLRRTFDADVAHWENGVRAMLR